ncbi:N4-gp56 family major capsid protein [Neobacillus sedimentimangrovi]|uniref:N4-gp56 family major capsid protein n=1 Tax=Neobacillus sedimentimangrovi TaxID=2699460 RepID=A0ABS8QKI7_9BACI|nr:N4-gp56 family major capsid protein [Neobacillus sedimentimangrovi]MCD4839736.1 N4-gp56 family major capsid protein [Neobacillus sedimentimangrovi]
MAQTKLSNLINPQVFSDELSVKLGDAIKLYPLAYVESFTGKEGSIISVPSYTYVGDADVIAEGVAIDPNLLNQGTVDVQVVKVGKAFELTDEAVKNGYGDPVGQAEKQLLASIAGGIEKKMFEALDTATLKHTTAEGAGVTGEEVLKALALFGEDYEGQKALLINPANMPQVMKDEAYVNGAIYGCEVQVSNRVPVGTAYIVKPEAVALYLSKEVQVEMDRDILKKSTVISADSHFATHLRDHSKAIKITLA